jgi:Protein of unknown function (DUF2510)
VASLDERPPAGWYTDPAGDHDLRYWDGNRWTTHAHGRATAVGGPVGAEGQATEPAATNGASASTTAECYRILCTDQRAVQLINGQRKGVARRERLVGVRQSWVVLEQIAIAYTTNWRKTLRQSQRVVAFETVSGKPFLPPQLGAEVIHRAPNGIHRIEPLYDPHEFIDGLYRLWNQYFEARQQAARQRCAGQLGARGIPVKDAQSLHLTPSDPLLLPVFVGLLAHNGGERLVVVEGARGSISEQLSQAFTHHLGYLRTQLSAARTVAVD